MSYRKNFKIRTQIDLTPCFEGVRRICVRILKFTDRCCTQITSGTLMVMPTTLPRFQVTQTSEIADALAIAAAEWPDAPRPELVTRLFREGATAIQHRQDRRAEAQRSAAIATQGILAYPSAYLAELQAEWPE